MKFDFRISLWNYSHYSNNFDFNTTIKEISQNGFGVEIWPWWENYFEIFSKNYREQLKKIVKGVPTSFHSWNSNTFEKHKIQIDTASYVNADIIVVHLDELVLNIKNPDYNFAKKVVDYAEKKEVLIVLENGNFNILKKCSEKIPNLKFCLDIGHIYYEKGSLKFYVDTFIDKVAHLHLHDTSFGKDEHFSLGCGSIPHNDWVYFIQALKKVNYKGAAVFELRPFLPVNLAINSKNVFMKLIEEQK